MYEDRWRTAVMSYTQQHFLKVLSFCSLVPVFSMYTVYNSVVSLVAWLSRVHVHIMSIAQQAGFAHCGWLTGCCAVALLHWALCAMYVWKGVREECTDMYIVVFFVCSVLL